MNYESLTMEQQDAIDNALKEVFRLQTLEDLNMWHNTVMYNDLKECIELEILRRERELSVSINEIIEHILEHTLAY